MGILDRAAPAGSTGVNARAGIFGDNAKCLEGLRPDKAKRAELGNLDEDVRADGEGKSERAGNIVGVDATLLHFGDEVNSRGEGQSNFFGRGCAGFLNSARPSTLPARGIWA